jgi:hypothetical protein
MQCNLSVCSKKAGNKIYDASIKRYTILFSTFFLHSYNNLKLQHGGLKRLSADVRRNSQMIEKLVRSLILMLFVLCITSLFMEQQAIFY